MDIPAVALLSSQFATGNPLVDAFTSQEAKGFFTKSGIVTLVLVLVFLALRHKLVQVVSIEENTVALRQSWGRVKYYYPRTARLIGWLLGNFVLAAPVLTFFIRRSGWFQKRLSKAGRLVVLHPGPHEVFRGMHSLIVVNLREIPMEVEEDTMTYQGRTLNYQLSATFQAAYDGTWWGEQNLVKFVFSVRDTNIHDGDIGALRDKLRSILVRATAKIVPLATPDKQRFPKLRFEQYYEIAGQEILELHGCYLRDVFSSPMSWTEGQLEKDGKIKGAKIEARAKIKAARILAKALQGDTSSVKKQTKRPHVVAAADQLLTESA